ncbi:hypothetical protein [Kurthia sibirica]|uniref:Uncharacterized protein n=1 Tax=Kurthia sibirica TaxID=202750 RepID=A0A2U3AK24_9BACL|nr:hypothetical protein [Kurthia sibirica]PWI24873.1 hypothetical protein DEX24_11475 [Kurthia sibirica]GEK35218.1 hypothetical protein KSI01_27510 [Kurthia sibirica]
MEGLIIFAIVSLVGFFLKKGKDEEVKESNKQMPTMNQSPSKPSEKSSQPRTKSLEDYMTKVAQEIEKKVTQTSSRTTNRPSMERQIPPAEESTEDSKPAREMSRETSKRQVAKRELSKRELSKESSRGSSSILTRSHALQAKREKTLEASKHHNTSGIFPNNTQELAQAIIMSEILAPPVSKRR